MTHTLIRLVISTLAAVWVGIVPLAGATPSAPFRKGEELLVERSAIGRPGGRVVVALRAEPRTFNPAVVTDGPSREVIGRMGADLIHINRRSQGTESALASAWTRSRDGREYMLTLRKGLRFSDGHPFDADDVVFTFKALLDPHVGSPNRDLLIIGGKPIDVKKIDAYHVRFAFAAPHAAAERLFDSLAILPRHLLEPAFVDGTLQDAWTMFTPAGSVAGLGPFRLKEYVAGQRLVLERNPYYWKVDRTAHRLPYIDELVFLFTGNEDAQAIRFQSGDSDVLDRVGADKFNLFTKAQASRGHQQ